MSYLECLIVLAIFAILLPIVLPNIDNMRRRYALFIAAEEVRRQLVDVQERAQLMSRNFGVYYYRRGGVWMYAVYADGNHNGVLHKDIDDGTDKLVAGPFRVLDRSGPVGVGIAEGVTDPDTLRAIDPGTPPIAFNRSFVCSFSPRGSGTPGSVYLTDGRLSALVRCSGSEGNLHKLYFAGAGKPWVVLR
jgi:type II secretory pathway pseudopilin PulG